MSFFEVGRNVVELAVDVVVVDEQRYIAVWIWMRAAGL
jgi:hypothetical protein